jgi:hypothetical protein
MSRRPSISATIALSNHPVPPFAQQVGQARPFVRPFGATPGIRELTSARPSNQSAGNKRTVVRLYG